MTKINVLDVVELKSRGKKLGPKFEPKEPESVLKLGFLPFS